MRYGKEEIAVVRTGIGSEKREYADDEADVDGPIKTEEGGLRGNNGDGLIGNDIVCLK